MLGILVAAGIYYLNPDSALLADNNENSVSVSMNANSIADMVDSVSPAVVLINTVVETSMNYGSYGMFFGYQQPQTYTQEGTGSGFIISGDGYILTNEHVIANASSITVTVSDNGIETRYPGTLIGSNESLDLAVVKIEADYSLPYLALGDSDNLRVGDWVVAIGNPYGLDHSVTMGIISAKGRPISTGDRDYTDLLQTDAAINSGNSGGPLLNLKGEVIGINTATTTTGTGIGFAIPSSTVASVLDNLMAGENAYIGIYYQEMSEDLVNYLGLEENATGVYVASVVDNSPAEKAGLRKGDIITQINGNAVASTADFANTVAKSKIGDKLELTVLRSGDTKEITVTVGNKE